MKTSYLCWLFILLVLIFSSLTFADTLYIDNDLGNDADPGNEENVIKEGEIVLVKNKGIDEDVTNQSAFKKTTYAYKKVAGVEILADVYRQLHDKIVPVVIDIHGGGLILGNRQHLSDRLRDKLIEKNYAVVAIDFRLAPETKLEQIMEDVQDAFHWVREKGPALFQADPDKIAIYGSSSGAFLALVAGCRLKIKPLAIIAVSGLADLELLVERENSDKSAFNRTEGPYSIVTSKPVTEGDAAGRMELAQYLGEHGWMLSEILGFDAKKEPARYTQFILSKNITTDFPPTLVLHARQDKFVPFTEVEKIQQALNDQQIEHEMVVVEEGHSSEIFKKYPEVLDRLGMFLDKYVK